MIVKPFLKFPGGKGYLADTIISHFPKKFGVYFEPMIGGGAIFFELISRNRIKRAVISDIHPWLMNAYSDILDDPQQVMMQLRLLRETHQRYVDKYDTAKKFYYKVRKYANKQGTPNAAFVIYLNKLCFNGLFRFNRKGQFNAPFGDQKNPSLFDAKNLLNISAFLREHTAFGEDNYINAVERAKKGDLVYLDPPYWPIRENSFTSYSRFGFNKDDHVKLARIATELKRKGIYVVVSNAATSEVKNLYKDFNIVTVQAPRRVNRSGTGRGKVKELIIKSF